MAGDGAPPAAALVPPAVTATSGAQSSEKYKLPVGGLSQLRPRRPMPPVCVSARIIEPCAAAAPRFESRLRRHRGWRRRVAIELSANRCASTLI